MPVYLDYGATTPLDPRVAAAMEPWGVEKFGNPHSAHRWGYEAAAAVALAREQVAVLIGAAPDRVQFTSGATESVNWALKGVLTAPGQRRNRIVTVATEHSCVLETARYLERLGATLTVLPVGEDGLVDIDDVEAAVSGDEVALVSTMLVNNEIGVIQPIADIAGIAHRHGALMHCDAAQGFGKMPVDVNALGIDLLSVTAHKCYGPKGIGALYIRDGVELEPLLQGGGQEDGRSGTLPTALCVGLGAAAALAQAELETGEAHARRLRDRLLGQLDFDYRINGALDPRWPGNLNFEVIGIAGERLLSSLRGIAVSSGSACAAQSGRPSHVLLALGRSPQAARASLRLGWGRFTTEADIDTAASELNAVVARLKAGRAA
ncbi:cysteine desulfurase [Polymorphobacter arshaanensis]|uniref:Cysteine desulfurase n=2 Tax=Glacieibacterium arshaanense TaxID=2511025 RepID=A0A4Y9ER98_9SPHN|nr:cysteine desulfurase [Polymorphobacter arshaanensis]